MTKRARNNGPYDVRVEVDPGNAYTEFVTVVPGGLLPTESDSGAPIKAETRDYLIKHHPDFSEVNQADQSSSSKTDNEKEDKS